MTYNAFGGTLNLKPTCESEVVVCGPFPMLTDAVEQSAGAQTSTADS